MKSMFGRIFFVISRYLLSFLGYQITLSTANIEFPELDKTEKDFITRIQSRGLTMTSYESMCVLASCCKYVINAGIQGDFVETGVWRGGSSILAAKLLPDNRGIHLFDTFEGMPEPGKEDFRIGEEDSSLTHAKWERLRADSGSHWVKSPINEVKKNFKDFAVENSRLYFVVGMVEETSVSHPVDTISILRIDTDFYSSTKSALCAFWPKLNTRGVLILDDYAHWDGARKAIDEYFQDKSILMLPIPNSGGRIVIKQE